ncbi:MAG: TonB-dependent receptor, partial [Bacteroidota bacterium]
MRHTTIGQLLILLILLVTANDLMAQDSIAWSIDVPDVVITGEYAPTHPSKAVHQIEVLDGEVLTKKGFTNLSEVLEYQLNFQVSSDPILGNGLSIQGISGQNVQILIDGVPVIGRLGGNVDLSQILTSQIERVEIVEGAMSAQYGSNASAGVVNIITKKSQIGAIGMDFSTQYESIGIQNHQFSLGFQDEVLYVQGNFQYQDYQFAPIDSMRLTEVVFDEDSTAMIVKKEPWNPKTQLTYGGLSRVQVNRNLVATYRLQHFEEELNIYGVVRRPFFLPYAFDEQYNTVRTDHNVSFEWDPQRPFHLTSTTAHNFYKRDDFTTRLDFDNDSTSLVAGLQDTTQFNTWLHRSIFSTNFKGRWNGQFGIEVMHESGSGDRLLDTLSSDPTVADMFNFAGWASATFQVYDRLKLKGNLRFGYNSDFAHPLIPSLHVHWAPNDRWNIRSSYSMGFRSPTLKELYFNFIDVNHFIIGNPAVKPETSHNLHGAVEFNKRFGNGLQLTSDAR